MQKFKTRWQVYPCPSEENSGEQITVPDDALTVRQILDTYVGTPHMGQAAYHAGEYDDDGTNDDMSYDAFDDPLLRPETTPMDLQNIVDDAHRKIRAARSRKKTEPEPEPRKAPEPAPEPEPKKE